MKRTFVTTALLAAALCLLSSVGWATTWYVKGVSGSDTNSCLSATTACKTIGHAISLAASGDTVAVAAGTYRENLVIGSNLNLVGASARTTIIDGGGVGSVVRISSVNAHVALSRVTIRNGLSVFGGGIKSFGTLTVSEVTITGNRGSSIGSYGGGIYSFGTLTISYSTIRGNVVSGNTAQGGGIYSARTLTINESIISGNSAAGAHFGQGGGIYININAPATINNSTISGNEASVSMCVSVCSPQGGGIYGSATINNSTISGNGATSGGGIYGPATLRNSIVANSLLGGNCSGKMRSKGYNLSSDTSCKFNGPGDMNSIDPMLGPLQNNGGPTKTMALLPGSPAIDAGNPSGCTDGHGHRLTTDQRGMPRPDKEDSGGCDIGAYESQSD